MQTSVTTDDNGGVMPNRFKDWAIDSWERCGEFLKCRPALVFCVFLASIFIAVITTASVYSTITATDNKNNITKITSSFCNTKAIGKPPTSQNTEICRELLDQLLKNPTNAQRERLRQLATERK